MKLEDVLDSPERLFGLGLGGVIALVGLGAVLFFITALFSILASREGCGVKILWLLIAFAAPFLGPLLWFVVGRRSAEQHR